MITGSGRYETLPTLKLILVFGWVNCTSVVLTLSIFPYCRWIPPPLPVTRSEHEKESASTYAAGRSRVILLQSHF